MPDIQLYAFPTSPYAMKVACYLAYKQIDYRFVGVSPVTFRQVAFTGKKQVPVLQINDEWKLESSDIGMWLESEFPQKPLLSSSARERESILEIDSWISEKLIPGMFRAAVDWPSISAGLHNGWRLARAVNQTTPLPFWVRFLWPFFIRRARFIVAMVNHLDRTQPLSKMQEKNIETFIQHLNGGPYLGGLATPSLADLSAFPVIVFPHRFGLRGAENWASNQTIAKWIAAVQQHLPPNPFLVNQTLLVHDTPGT